MVDTKGIGQPFSWKGTGDEDFGEWSHKVRMFMLAKFGDQILTALTWAPRQRKIVVKTCVASQRDRFVAWISVFGEHAEEDEQIENIDDFVGKLYAYLISFKRRTQPICSELCKRKWLGSMETIARWVRPHVHATRGDPSAISEPSSMPTEDLGSALEDWLSKKRHYEMFTDRNGRPCQASDDSLVAAMFRLMPKNLEETVMFTNEDEGFQELFVRLLAYSSTKQSIKIREIKRQNRRDDPIEVDALSKGKRKGKKGSSGSGKGKGQNSTSNAVCWTCGKSGHYEKDCRQKWTQNKEWSRKKGKGKGKSKGKGKLNSVEKWQEGAQSDEHADGWTWSDEQAEEWWKATDDQNGSSSVQWMSANDQTAWEPEGLVGGIAMNSIETKYIEQDQLGQKWLRLNYDSGAALTALPIAIAGNLPLEKCDEFRGASGAIIPNLGKVKMKSTDESGIEKINIT